MEPNNHLNILQILLESDIIIQIIILILIFASVFTWAVALYKYRFFQKLNRNAKAIESEIIHLHSIQEIQSMLKKYGKSPMFDIFHEISADIRYRNRVDYGILDAIIEIHKSKVFANYNQFTLYFATIGSISPFVGLLGTVWGIMNSFKSISLVEQVSLALIAPGISEALFATAIGLLVAIPAVIFYNLFTATVKNYMDRVDNFASNILIRIAK